MDDNFFRIVPLRKGQEGQGYTYYACMQVSTGLYMTTWYKFRQIDIHSTYLKIYSTAEKAIGLMQAMGYTLDTESELLVRMSPEGVELSRMKNKLEGAFFNLQGELVTQGGSMNTGVFDFQIPADVEVVGLRQLSPYGWMLCEERVTSRTLTGRAWIPDVAWPRNCVNIQ